MAIVEALRHKTARTKPMKERNCFECVMVSSSRQVRVFNSIPGVAQGSRETPCRPGKDHKDERKMLWRGKQFFFQCQASLGRGPVAALPRLCSRPGRCAQAGSPSAEWNHTNGNAYRIRLRLEIHFGIIRLSENKF
jgi:hypothetical protein